ncbi:MAG: D-alanyl-D-alanine carboxypeptidase [Oscillospiraceae bacterium]|nr:D-alanyl-D-alanine carboxypeptidase [Oscillospiraceae bacterium]
MVKKTAIILIFIISLQFLAFIPAAASSHFGNIAASSAILAEKGTGIVLFDKNMHQRHPADSLTKVMTLLLAAQAIENDEISDNELIEITDAAWHDIDGSSTTQGISPGSVMTFIDLMYAAFVGSSNEACNMIALRLAGNIKSFVDIMNNNAAELGLADTNFVNPHGQHHSNQYTTAYDMYVLYSEASKSVLFNEISSTYRHVTERSEETDSRNLVSTNSLLNQNGIYFYRYCNSGIASITYEGGHSLVAAAEEEGLSLISVVLGAKAIINDDESVNLQHFTETHRLFLWGYQNFGWREILKTTDLLARVPVLHGSGADSVNVRPEEPLTLLLDNSIPSESFIFNITIFSEVRNSPLVAPIEAGDKLGEVIITFNGVEYAKIALVANTNIELNGIEFMRRQISDILSTPLARNIIIVLIIIVAIYAALVIRYNIMRINRLRRIRDAKNEIIRERHEDFRD